MARRVAGSSRWAPTERRRGLTLQSLYLSLWLYGPKQHGYAGYMLNGGNGLANCSISWQLGVVDLYLREHAASLMAAVPAIGIANWDGCACRERLLELIEIAHKAGFIVFKFETELMRIVRDASKRGRS